MGSDCYTPIVHLEIELKRGIVVGENFKKNS